MSRVVSVLFMLPGCPGRQRVEANASIGLNRSNTVRYKSYCILIKWGFLYLRYRPKYWWYEGVVWGRKFAYLGLHALVSWRHRRSLPCTLPRVRGWLVAFRSGEFGCRMGPCGALLCVSMFHTSYKHIHSMYSSSKADIVDTY